MIAIIKNIIYTTGMKIHNGLHLTNTYIYTHTHTHTNTQINILLVIWAYMDEIISL